MKEADLIKAIDEALDKEIRVLAVYLLGMYIRFNEDRKEVLDAYRAR